MFFKFLVTYVTLNLAFSKLIKYVLFRLTEKVIFIIVGGCFSKNNSQIYSSLEDCYIFISCLYKNIFFFTVNLTFIKTTCTFSRLYSLLMMFNICAKVCEFIITKDSCIFGVNRMQCVRK